MLRQITDQPKRYTRKKKEKARRQPKPARAFRQAEEKIPTNQLINRRRKEERVETGTEESDQGRKYTVNWEKSLREKLNEKYSR